MELLLVVFLVPVRWQHQWSTKAALDCNYETNIQKLKKKNKSLYFLQKEDFFSNRYRRRCKFKGMNTIEFWFQIDSFWILVRNISLLAAKKFQVEGLWRWLLICSCFLGGSYLIKTSLDLSQKVEEQCLTKDFRYYRAVNLDIVFLQYCLLRTHLIYSGGILNQPCSGTGGNRTQWMQRCAKMKYHC